MIAICGSQQKDNRQQIVAWLATKEVGRMFAFRLHRCADASCLFLELQFHPFVRLFAQIRNRISENFTNKDPAYIEWSVPV